MASAQTWSSADEVLKAARNVMRFLIRTPSFTIPALTSLALGIAVNTTLFSVFNAVILKPLGPSNGGELVRIGRSLNNDGSFRSATREELEYLRKHGASFQAITGHQIETLAMPAPDGAQLVSGEWVADDYFAVLGVQPRVGRGFNADETAAGSAAPVAVISERFRRRALEGREAVGSTLRLGQSQFTVIGVAPPDFTGTFPGIATDVWLPASSWMLAKPAANGGTEPSLSLTARLREGVSMETARAELETLSRRLLAEDPERDRARGFAIGSARGVVPLLANVLRVFLLLMMAVVAIVLFIACANVASLLLARGVARRGELAIRQACGASRARVAGMLLVESMVLALLGAAIGIALTLAAVRALRGHAITTGPTGAPVFFDIQVDTTVLVFVAVVTTATALVFGLAPAIAATRLDLVSALKGIAPFGRRRGRIRGALVVVQVTLSFVLLVGAALLLQSVRTAARLDLGFDPDSVVAASFELTTFGENRARVTAFYDEVRRRVEAMPGVERLSLATFTPMIGGGAFRSVRVPDAQAEHNVYQTAVSEGFFATIRQPLVRGRDFTSDEATSNVGVAIVNETMARRLWPNSEAIGQRLRIADDSVERVVVGVASDARMRSFGGDTPPLLYFPVRRGSEVRATLYLRTPTPAQTAAELRRIVGDIDPTVAVRASTLRDAMAFALVPARVGQIVFGFAGAIALLIAATGLYGLVSYTLTQRLKEVGIRIALGATRGSIFAFVVGGTFRLMVIGVVIGAAVAAVVMRLLSSLLYGLSPTDPATFGGIALVLFLVTLAAGYAAARRGLGVNPVTILRYE